MNYKPHSLTLVPAALAVCGVVTGLLASISPAAPRTAETADPPAASATAAETPSDAGQTPAPSTGSGGPASSTTDAPADSAAVTGSLPTADDLLQQVRSRLDGLSSLQCDLQQTVIFSGMKFSAAGHYVQASGNRLRLEFQVAPAVSAAAADRAAGLLTAAEPPAPDAKSPAQPSADGKSADGKVAPTGASLLQVSDGSVLYTSWQNGPETRVTRRNINDILKAAGESSLYDPGRALQDLGLGGLNALLSRIQTSMDFAPVRRETIGEVEFLVLTGRWNQKIRKDVFQLPDDAEVISQDFIPEYLRLYIDTGSSLPRRLQYLKRDPDPARRRVRPLLTLDLRRIVLNEPVDESLFAFAPPDNVPQEDLTEQTIQGIRNAGLPPASPAGATIPGLPPGAAPPGAAPPGAAPPTGPATTPADRAATPASGAETGRPGPGLPTNPG